MTKAMRGFGLLIVVALLVGELHCARTAPPADAPATPPQSPEPPADQQTPPQAPGPTPPPRRQRSPHRRAPPPPPPKQDPAPPRLVVPPQEPGEAAPAPPGNGMINRTMGCTTLLVFGDSTVDPGNNNHLATTARANFLPYGLNFFGRRPTGRFSNGRLATDMLAERLGIGRTIPGFFDPNLRLLQLRRGVSFASGGSGYDDSTANRLNVVSLTAQMHNLFRYKLLIRTLLGPRRAERLVNRATFIISTGTNDMLSIYLASNQSSAISTAVYENYLIAHVANYTQVMRMLGGRRFIFVGLPPMGCLPIARTLLGTGADRCDENLNQLANSFNSKLVQLLNFINYQNQIKTSYIDTYTIIHEATADPKNFGLSEVSRGCCGSGVIEVAQTCRGRRTCGDPSKYLYWDAVHPTERTNQLITDVMMDSIRELYNS
ncbi:GDSL esterase/lipase At5g45950-like [Phragmites australis]|uniref:GDSL esterase/lipase At5g45950-like n=1 Tax=Phragmites australis TaxID=29695 RepID=UPI002D7894A1|nr:GDSL esterase/lipase At5g45950-like [Phragmites australis]